VCHPRVCGAAFFGQNKKEKFKKKEKAIFLSFLNFLSLFLSHKRQHFYNLRGGEFNRVVNPFVTLKYKKTRKNGRIYLSCFFCFLCICEKKL